jgi:hypothetical protein
MAAEVRDYLLVRRMKYWRDIARCPLVNVRVPTWRARKNFWSLVRRYPALAAQNGLTATSVFCEKRISDCQRHK